MSRPLVILNTHPIQYHAPLFREMARRGLPFEVWYCHRPSEKAQAAAGFGVEFAWDVELLEGYRWRCLEDEGTGGSGGKLRRWLAATRPRAVLIYGWHFREAREAIAHCVLLRIPYYLRSDSQYAERRPLVTRMVKAGPYRAMIGLAAGCVPVGSRSAAYFRYYGCPEKKLRLVPHCVDDGLFGEDGPRNVKRAEWGLAESDFVFLFCGKFVSWKYPMEFVKAVEGVAATHGRRVAAVMVGDGPLRADCARYIENRGLRVHLAGFVNQTRLPEYYRSVDCLVLPSEETWGLVVNEAMLAGVPAIVSDAVGCGPEMVEAGRNGGVYAHGDWAGLAERMRSLLELDDATMRVWRERSRERAERFSVARVAEAMIREIGGGARVG